MFFIEDYMAKLRLAFGKIITKKHDKINLIDHSYNALEETNAVKLSRDSSTILSFLDVVIRDLNGLQCLIGYYGYALGDKYSIIDPDKKTISEQDYIKPPFKSKAIFIITESGFIIFEEKSESYIEPEKIRDALESAFRAYAIEKPITINLMELADDSNTMIEFINSLNKLTLIEFSNLKHSNPSEVSEFFDEATNARIDTIIESSNDEIGIDREHQEFKNQIAHTKRYGKLRRVEGIAVDGFRAMETAQNKIRLTVTVLDKEMDTKIQKMLAVFEQMRKKLSGE